MTCASCGAVNASSARFCDECGAALVEACANCGAVPRRPEAQFCSECGAKLGGAAAMSAGPGDGNAATKPLAERRMCSVLFADLVGFTPLSEARDPEVVRELLSRYFDVTRAVIERYGGTVEKFIGDAVMAVWGAPVATEGDAERAVRAGLDVVDAVAGLGSEVGAPALAARAGVVTGEVAVSFGAQGEGMVAGDPVNTAARVQSAAAPGTVWVDDATRRLAAAGVGFDDVGEHALKGKAEAQRLWCATRLLALVGGVQRIDGLEAPLIGRDPELRAIKDLFHATVERRTPRLVSVTGVAGVGKSRLGWELEKHIDGLAQGVRWHRGRCLSYGEGVAFWALAQAVRQRFTIAEDDPVDVARTKLAVALPALLPDAAEREFVEVRLGRLLGVAVDADPSTPIPKEDLFAGWRLFFQRQAAAAPTVWLIEDLQYADPALVEFVDSLLDWSRDLPIFVVALGRSDVIDRFPGFGVGRNRTSLTVEPLDAVSMDRLVDALVPGMPRTARETITAHAQGVPLYVVETIRALVDRDVVRPIEGTYRLVDDIGHLAVPDTLHGLLAARLDALAPAVRALATEAAVLGTSFAFEALVAVSQQDEASVRAALDELVRREVLYVSAELLSPERGAYHFAQGLVRQVAYETLSRRDRKARHLRVAAYLRTSLPDDGDEVADVIARHYRDALAAVPEDLDAAEIRDLAIEMTARAGARALRTGAARAATDAYAAAAALAEAAERPDAGTFWEKSNEASRYAGSFALSLEYARREQRFYERVGDQRRAAAARARVARSLRIAGRHSEALEEVTAALEVLRDPPDRDTVAALTQLSSVKIFSDAPDALAVMDETLRLARELEVEPSLYSSILALAGIARDFHFQSAQAAELLREAIRVAEQSGDSVGRVHALTNLANTLAPFDPLAAAEVARQAMELGRQLGGRSFVAHAVSDLAEALAVTGSWDEASELLHEAIDGDGLDDQWVVNVCGALVAGLRGDARTAHQRLQRVRPAFVDSEDVQSQIALSLAEASAAYADGDVPATLRWARNAVEQAPIMGFANEFRRWSWTLAVQAARHLEDCAALDALLTVVEALPADHVSAVLRGQATSTRAYQRGRADPDAAAAMHEQAIAMLRAVPAPYHLALALLERGEERDVEEARAIAERLGAAPLLRLVSTSGRYSDPTR